MQEHDSIDKVSGQQFLSRAPSRRMIPVDGASGYSWNQIREHQSPVSRSARTRITAGDLG